MLKTNLVLLAAITALTLRSASADPLPQPRMQEALASLRDARASLIKAEANKNGHRAKAIELVNQAIAEVEAGMAQAR